MTQAFFRLVARSWARLMTKFSMSTTGFIALSCVLPILIYLALVLIPAYSERRTDVGFRRSAWNRVKGSGRQTLISLVVFLLFWVVSVSISLAQTLYDDHQTLVTKVVQLNQQISSLTKERDEWQGKSEQLQREPRAKSARVTQNTHVSDSVSAPPNEEKKCWWGNLAGYPNSKIEGAVTADAAIIHCNYKIDAPYLVQVEFDRDFIPGATTIADAGFTSDGEGKNGFVRWNKITSPALLSGQLVIVTVYGRTDQYPRAKAVKIETLQ